MSKALMALAVMALGCAPAGDPFPPLADAAAAVPVGNCRPCGVNATGADVWETWILGATDLGVEVALGGVRDDPLGPGSAWCPLVGSGPAFTIDFDGHRETFECPAGASPEIEVGNGE